MEKNVRGEGMERRRMLEGGIEKNVRVMLVGGC